MDYTEELKRIDQKYYPIIVEKYGKYIKNLDKKDRLYKKTYIIPDNKWYKYAKSKPIRGICVTRNGNIYIRESAFCEQIVIHEYIHRLSRNFRHKEKIFFGWVEGIMYSYPGLNYNGINELLTEWIAYSVTGIYEELNPYCLEFKYIVYWQQRPDIFENLIKAYFSGDIQLFDNELWKIYQAETFNKIKQIDSEIHKFVSMKV